MTFFAAVSAAPNTGIVWSVQEGASGGTLSATGQYTAPATTGTYHVVAKSKDDASLSATAEVTVSMPRSCTNVPAAGTWDNTSIAPVVAPPQESYEFTGKSTSVIVDPYDPSTVWLGTGYKGLYKSVDCGGSWKKVNTGKNGDAIDASVLWSTIIDPSNQGVIYAVAAYGPGGMYKSTNFGVDWVQLFPKTSKFAQAKSDNFVNNVSMDPSNPLHLVVASHGSCVAPNPNGCFSESFDGGATWPTLTSMPAQWGEKGGVQVINATTWVWGTGDNSEGLFVTINNGKDWTHPLKGTVGDGAGEFTSQPLTRAADGAFYIAGLEGVLRSTDGVAWTRAWEDKNGVTPAVAAVVVTPTTIFASNGTDYFSAPLSDFKNWSALKGPKGNTDSAQFLDYDPTHRLIYSSCWGGGLFRYLVPN